MESILTLAAADAFELAMSMKALVSQATEGADTWKDQQELLPFTVTFLRLVREGARLVQLKHLLSEVDQVGRSRSTRLPSPGGLRAPK